MRFWAVVLCLSWLPCAAQCTATPPSQASGYSLQFCDNFATLDVTTGTAPGHNWYNPGLYYAGASGNITDPSGTYVDMQWFSAQGNFSTSMATYNQAAGVGRAWTYGYFEASIKFPDATGSWPGFFLISPFQQAQCNAGVPYPELDIMEWQSNTPTEFLGTAHVWQAQSGCTGGAFIGSSGVTPVVTINDNNYHTYGFLWTTSSVTWYVDNVSQGSVNTLAWPYNLVYGGTPPCTTAPYSGCVSPLAVILTQQAGCNFIFGGCSGQVTPLDMQVAFVHVFQQPVLTPGDRITGNALISRGIAIR